jgi:hypothetical protein
MAFRPKPSFRIRVEPAKAGFLDRIFMGKFADAEASARFQAAGEAARWFAARRLPAAKALPMSASQRREQQYPEGLRLFKANPAPNMPAIRLKPKGRKTPLNLSRPWYSVDSTNRPRNLFIGPPRVLSGSSKPVPALLESGGRMRKGSRMRQRTVGQGGEIRTDGRPSRTNRLIVSDFGPAMPVTYIKIRTAKQARRANLIQRDLFKPPTIVYQPPRKYMERIVDEAMRSELYAKKINSLMANWRKTGKSRFRLQVAS